MKGSLMRQLLTSLVSYGKVTTTEAKAKALKREMDRLVSRSKDLSLVTRRKALSLFTTKSAARKFLDQVVPQFKERIGGYVRVTKLSHRRGDRAPLARIEFVEEIKEKTEKPKPATGEAGKTPSKARSAKPKSALRKPAAKNKAAAEKK